MWTSYRDTLNSTFPLGFKLGTLPEEYQHHLCSGNLLTQLVLSINFKIRPSQKEIPNAVFVYLTINRAKLRLYLFRVTFVH